jgi:hypothetical protein
MKEPGNGGNGESGRKTEISPKPGYRQITV